MKAKRLSCIATGLNFFASIVTSKKLKSDKLVQVVTTEGFIKEVILNHHPQRLLYDYANAAVLALEERLENEELSQE